MHLTVHGALIFFGKTIPYLWFDNLNFCNSFLLLLFFQKKRRIHFLEIIEDIWEKLNLGSHFVIRCKRIRTVFSLIQLDFGVSCCSLVDGGHLVHFICTLFYY